MIAEIVTESNRYEYFALLDGIDSAEVVEEASWVLNIRSHPAAGRIDNADGPLPVRTYVYSVDDFCGEILIWTDSGKLSGLEYAWVTDDPPLRWPNRDELRVNAD